MLVEHNAQMRPFEQRRQQALALFDRLALQILAVELEQIKSAKYGQNMRFVRHKIREQRMTLFAAAHESVNGRFCCRSRLQAFLVSDSVAVM
jgi:hypothetical protein